MIPIIDLRQQTEVVYPTGHALLLTSLSSPNNLRGTGAYRIATYLRNRGWDIDVLDYFVFLSDEQLEDYLNHTIKPETKWIGISYTWLSSNDRMFEVVKIIRKKYPNIKLILGGQWPFEREVDADWYILGYGEYAIDAVLCYEFSNGPPPKSSPLFTGKYVNAYHDYRATPFENYNIDYRADDYLTKEVSLTIELSRGCRFACKFCDFPFLGIKNDTSSDEESLYRNFMENYDNYGITAYTISDDTYNDRMEKMIKFRNVINRLPFKPDFKAFIRIDLLKTHPEQLELLAESRIWMQLYGIETFNKAAGKAIGKGLDGDVKKHLLLTVKDYMTKHVGLYRSTASFIAGLPYETIDSMRETYAWLNENWVNQHYDWWALNIYKNRDVLSAFGDDMTKFGYSEIPEEEVAKRALADTYILRDSSNQVYWRNKETDIYECHDLVSEFKQGDEVLDAYGVVKYLPLYNMDYEKVLSIRRPKFPRVDTFDYRKKSAKLIRDYIQKKLTFDNK